MPTIVLDDRGTEISYLDSGPIENKIYTTFIVIHGGNWYNGIFSRIVALAPQRGLRLICLNRRDFPGSTPYGVEEIAPIQNGADPESFKQFRAARGHEIGRFICGVIEQEHLPSVHHKPDGIVGGVALMGWSLGNSFGIATLAHMGTMRPELSALLQEYIHTYVAFDAPHFIVGREVPPGVEDSLARKLFGGPAPADPYEVGKFLSSYFSHEIDEIRGTYRFALEPDPEKASTVSTMSPEEVRSCLAVDPPVSEHWWRLRGALEGGFGEDTQAVLFPSGETCQWRPRIRWVYCDQAMWHSVWAAFRVQSELDRQGADGKRTVEVIRLRGANHFVHWDDPHKMMKVLDLCLM